ncbi:L10-interacting MYB domain-containing protein-like [Gastrolobium bilobum]|uniref:L10-interacting MYB domain-containing protein-like n=1 Tax=Gastrolobium bilobum TaxID=150636 RepID=UPI002AB1784C|nr:L10-interacting MYB domain-containing protein-like [Gastrolobium bilobum]
MDQYFIELLLDQLDRGNTVNNEFNRKAWTEMLAMFNAKFGPQHTKRILRHRFRKLMKYYFVITKILKTPGFSWDTQQQMLAADDDEWDAYVKQHPHARWYRLKTFPNYQDLELIFRNLSDLEFSDLYPEKYYGDVASVIKAGDREGNRNPSVTDRTRTYWTPPMDRCLIDLLLEQVKNGNKLGQTFISKAWNDILNSFNKQFKSQYDKDVLKSRYKNLRKQFYDVFNILRHSGFSWDDITEMVVAADHVWDAYIKAHPEAGSIKVKTLPGYRKLCVIFGKESPDKICFSLSHNANSGVESPKLQTGSILLKCEGERRNCNVPSVYDAASTVEWTESLECYFVDLMVEQVNRGNKTRNSFNEEAWTHMIEAFSSKFGLQCDKQLLEDQYFCLMKRHDNMSILFSHNGYACDENLQIMLAQNSVWDSYIKDHPEAIL